MMIRNGLKAFSGNFILVWKHLAYLLVAIALSAGLFMLAFQPIVNQLSLSGWTQQFTDFFELFYTDFGGVADAFSSLATNFYLILKAGLSSQWFNYVLCLLTLLVVPNFLYGVGEYVVGVLVGSRMSTLLSLSYTNRLFKTAGRSSLYSLWKMLLSLPFWLIIIAVCFGYGVLANSVSGAWLLLPIFIGLVLFVLAFKYVVMIGFLPEATQHSVSVIRAFTRGIDIYTGQFFKKLFFVWGLYILEFGGVLMITLFTIGVGIPIAISGVLVLNVCISYSNFFNTRKENFYTSDGIIVKPL